MIILVILILGACSESSSKEDNFVKGLMKDQKITEKQAKCLINETKPLVKKEEWNKYVEIWNMKEEGQDINDNDMQTVMNVAFSMMGVANKCDVTFQ